MNTESSEKRPPASPVYRSRKYAMLNKPIEIDRHLERVRRYLRPRWDDHLLEIGCSRGFLTQRVREELAPSTTGVDLNPEAIANACVDGLSVMDAQALAYDDESFDKIYSFHCIEHIPDLHGALREMNRVLRPGGRILLVYPAEPIRGLYVVPTAIILFGNALRAREIHLHKLWPAKIERMLTATSLEVTASALDLLLTPQFITVLEKGSRSAKVAVARAQTGTGRERARQPVTTP
jgi:ubiquinone/menaquinone biosynthesis C-methylase UbiE